MTPNAVTGVRARAHIAISNISIHRGDTLVLDSVDLSVSSTSRIAVVGENGSGKSTLLQVLAGQIRPDHGKVTVVGRVGVADQEMPTTDDRTVGDAVTAAIAESVRALDALNRAAVALADGTSGAADRYAVALATAEALGAWDAERLVGVALDALAAETDWSRRLADLSVGQRYRVRLACLLGGDDDLLLLDEPTNHLDADGLVFLTEQLRSRTGGYVVVTHDRALLADVARTIVDLDPTPDGKPRVYGDGYEGYRAGRATLRAHWEQEYEREQKERRRLQDDLSAAQNRLVDGWRPDKGTGKHQRATRSGSIVQRVKRRQEALDAQAITVPEPPVVLRFPDLPAGPTRTLLVAESVGFGARIDAPVTAAVSAGDRLVVTGPNGAGKSTLLAILAGDLDPTAGAVYRSPGARVAWLRQESSLPHEQRAGRAFLAHVDALVASGEVPVGEIVGLAQLGLLRSRDTGKRIGDLSVGQQRRLDLAMALAGRPHLLLLDEPTNHLSIALVDELTEALSATAAAVVVSSHDRQLLKDTRGWPQLRLGDASASSPR